MNPNKYSHPCITQSQSTVRELCNSGKSAHVSLDELANILLKYVLSSTSSTMSMTSGNSWFFDSNCYNHMTDDPSIFLDKTHVSHLSLINTINGSSLHVNHIGSVSTLNLSLPVTFHLPKLTINLIYVGQLCDLGLNIIFSSSSCYVLDL